MLARKVFRPNVRQVKLIARHASTLQRSSQRRHSDDLASYDTEQVYRTLSYRGSVGDINGVWDTVRELVCKRHELPNTRLYGALIQANEDGKDGCAGTVDTLLQEFDQEGFDVDQKICCDALRALAVHPEPLLRGHLLEEMRQRWISPDHETLNLVLLGLLRDGQVENALEQLQDLQRKGVQIRSWIFDIAAYMLCDLGEVDEAVDILKRRVIDGDTNVHSLVWFHVFDAACEQLNHDAIDFIWFRCVEKSIFNPTSGQCLAVLNSASQSGRVKLATDVFKVFSERRTTFDSHHYELLMGAYLLNEDIKTPLTILCIMNRAGITPDQGSTVPILNSIRSSTERIAETFSILEHLNETGRTVPTAALNCIIEAALLNDDLPGAIAYYKSLHKICPAGPNIVTFNTLLKGCKDMQRKKTAMFLVSEMIALGVTPSRLTYDRLILTCLQEEDHEDGLRYYEEMKQLKLHPRFGTLKVMAEKCCAAGDERCWDLVADMHMQGMPTFELRESMATTWRALRAEGRLDAEQESRPRQIADMIDA
ncbi:MAG: hypothetical protein M1828_003190 [Chrysothrix sp. TS-e1954]|nr:MAG: hypothetical protein M1828_003190 [Chrysothrix sp. TS-e1954]